MFLHIQYLLYWFFILKIAEFITNRTYMSINRESERAATRGHAAFYNLVLNSESLNDDYTQLRARLLGKDVVPHADFKIEQLSATEGNIHFCADPMFQAEQFVGFLMLRGELNRVGYKKLFGNFFDAKNIPIVQRLLQESRNEHFVNDYYDIQWYNAPPGGLLDLVDYFKEKLPERIFRKCKRKLAGNGRPSATRNG